jgi:hypothetical protein
MFKLQQLDGDVAQLVRAPHCHCGGRGFESRRFRHVCKFQNKIPVSKKARFTGLGFSGTFYFWQTGILLWNLDGLGGWVDTNGFIDKVASFN